MIALLASLLLGSDSASAIAARYAAAVGSRSHVIAELRVQFPGGQSLQGRFLYLEPYYQRVRLAGEDLDWEFAQTPGAIFEIMHEDRVYDFFGGFESLMPPPNAVSGFAEYTYPSFLMPYVQTNLEQITGWTGGEAVTVNGVETNRISVSSTAPDGTTTTREFFIASDGMPRRMVFTNSGELGSVTFVTDVLSIDLNTRPKPADFAAKPGVGYVPYRLPMPPAPLDPGAGWPDAAWIDPKTERPVQPGRLFEGKAVLLILTAPDCAVSERLEPQLKELREALSVSPVQVVELSLGEEKPSMEAKDPARAVYWDRDGAFEQARPVPGTPFFMLWDGKGSMRRQWLGAPTDGWRKIREEILQAAGELRL